MNNHLKITLIKSTIGRKPKHITIAKLLGLKKLNSTAIHPDSPSIRGMINVIEYMLNIEECA